MTENGASEVRGRRSDGRPVFAEGFRLRSASYAETRRRGRQRAEDRRQTAEPAVGAETHGIDDL